MSELFHADKASSPASGSTTLAGPAQRALAALGLFALESTDLGRVLDAAVHTVRDVLGTDFALIGELTPDGSMLRIAAGVGWPSDVIGASALPAGRGSLAGFTLLTEEPVVMDDVRTETRFAKPELLVERGIASGLAVSIPMRGSERRPFGVLAAHTLSERRFTEGDTTFLRVVANILAAAIARVQTEAKLEQLAASSAKARLHLETIVRGSPLAIVGLNPDGLVSAWNPAAERLLGWREEEVLGRPVPTVPDEERASFEENVRRVMAGEALVTQVRRRHRDGTMLELSLWAAPRRDIDGRLIDVLCVLADETEPRRTREALERALGEARDAVRLRENILGVVSHDLRSPLGVIMLNARLLHARLGADAKTKRSLEIILSSATRMERLISDLLDVASIEAGHLSVELHACPVQPLLEDAEAAARPKMAEKFVRVECQNEVPPDVKVVCDRERLLQVFGNIIGNAVKFSLPASVVRVNAKQISPAEVQFEIEDTGPGIPPDELPDIFQPYWTAKRRGEKGTGLGLFISKSIVEAHGGRVWVKSELGAGTKFFFALPVRG